MCNVCFTGWSGLITALATPRSIRLTRQAKNLTTVRLHFYIFNDIQITILYIHTVNLSFKVRFYSGRLGEQIDLSRLLTIIRSGELYSLAIQPSNLGYEIKAEIISSDQGICGVTVKRVGHVQFHTIQEAQTAIIDALRSEPARLIDWHLLARDGTSLLCGAPLKQGKKRFQTTSVDKFFSDAVVFPGPRCCRCKTQAFVFGLSPQPAPRSATNQ